MSDKPKDDDWGMTMPHMRLEKDKNADDFTDDFAPNPYSAKNPSSADDWGITQQNFNQPHNQPPVSDFDKTTPNINIPKDVWQDENPGAPRQASSDDWGMTTPNINISGAQRQDDWGATAPNINVPPENKPDDWGMTVPNAGIPKQEKRDDWSMPAPVFRISEGEKVDNLPKRTPNFNQNEADNFDKTTPNFNLSEISPPAYGATAPNLDLQSQPKISEPPLPSDQNAAETPKAERTGGGSKMIYVLGGLIALLFFGIVALAGAYFLFLNKPQTAQVYETPKEEPKETIPAAAPIVTSDAKTDLPKEINYKGAMVLVSAGEFAMGSDTDADESKPMHKVTLPAFYIDKTEVTNVEYKKFCDETGKSYPKDPHLEKDYFTRRPNAPVVGVSFADAKAYAAWAGKRLPTEAEWEKAASWDEASQSKRAFPWGNDFQKSSVAFGINSISDVGKFASGASAYGALDMAGNVLEWVDAFFQPYPDSTATNAEFGEKNRVVRGGHFGSKSNDSLKTTKRIYVSPDIASGEDDEKLVAAIIGFRCAVSADDPAVREVLQTQSK